MKSSSKNPLHSLVELGQSVWLDDFRHSWLQDNTLARLISEDKISGVTSNPTIFEQAIAETHEYDHAIKNLSDKNLNSQEIYETLVVKDVQRISDLLLQVYEKTSGHDGYVSLEVSPNLAYDTEGTIIEAKHLWSRVARPNLMIKVPGTNAGLPAIRNLVSEGINVNVTLLFSSKSLP
jgi:transaldolase